MSHLEELLPEFRNGAKIRCKYWAPDMFIQNIDDDDIDIEDLSRDDWEFYQDPIDWQYIIDHKCLCWFGVIGKEKQRIGTIEHVAEFGKCCTYYINHDEGFSSCRPVRKDEVTFYEDKKDEL